MANKSFNQNSNFYVNNGKFVGGYNNIASGTTATFIGGGTGNTIGTGVTYSNIIGGSGNTINSGVTSSNIIGGSDNTITTSDQSSVGGGQSNTITNSNYSFIGVGENNNITSDSRHSVIAGGKDNTLNGVSSVGEGFIGAGLSNTINGFRAFIGAGQNNVAGSRASVVGGQSNTATTSSFVGGGQGNNANNTQSAIVGGENNINNSRNGFIGGGSGNVIQNITWGSVIVGGVSNVLDGAYSFIGGGKSNTLNLAPYSTIGGGYANSITEGNTYSNALIASGWLNSIKGGAYTTIGGGYKNTISGASSDYSNTILNGFNNDIIGGGYSTILNGSGNYISGFSNTHIIGSNITGTTANTTYVNNLNIYDTPSSGDSISTNLDSVLFRETDGTVKTVDVSNLGTTGGTFTASASTLSLTNSLGNTVSVSGISGLYIFENIAFVDGNGNDTTAQLGNEHLPYRTISAAKIAVVASLDDNALIYIYPGIYSETADFTYASDGITMNYFALPGVTIDIKDSNEPFRFAPAGSAAGFTDSTVNFYGNAIFNLYNGSLYYAGNAGTSGDNNRLYCEADSISQILTGGTGFALINPHTSNCNIDLKVKNITVESGFMSLATNDVSGKMSIECEDFNFSTRSGKTASFQSGDGKEFNTVFKNSTLNLTDALIRNVSCDTLFDNCTINQVGRDLFTGVTTSRILAFRNTDVLFSGTPASYAVLDMSGGTQDIYALNNINTNGNITGGTTTFTIKGNGTINELDSDLTDLRDLML